MFSYSHILDMFFYRPTLAMLPPRIDGRIWAEAGPLSRPKRHILQLCTLVSVHTNRACWDYNNYGCFCGLGNADSSPVDSADSCCRSHDRCYTNIQCFLLYPHFVSYSYECTSAGCQCTDSPTVSPCAYFTCKCDLKLSRCLAKAPFNPSFSSYNRDQCPKSSSSTTRRRRKKKSVKKMKARRLKTQQKGKSNGKEKKKQRENRQ
ncbi:unnamed protein product [Candidula unifasciata]|uniref:Phospholipase A2 n=1 Tax=Candidula unifasciata TaxID=100452 RepID=A0A8S3Z5T4_9EUPU|nr:unnamed protein product [Candidula unifasciata]